MNETIQRYNGKLYLDNILETDEQNQCRQNYPKLFVLTYDSGMVARREQKNFSGAGKHTARFIVHEEEVLKV